MITDPGVFDNEYLPRELKHREGPVETLAKAFEPTIDGYPADNVLVSGGSGVGKTVLVRYALARLDEAAAINHAHIRCLGITRGQILRTAIDEYDSTIDFTLNTSVDTLQEKLSDAVISPYIIVLDEADGIYETGALEDLFAIQRVSVVAICHDAERWLALATPEVRAVMHRELELGRYGVDELADILQDRVDEGLPPGVITREQLRTIADECAGIARIAIQSLRAAAELAGERGHERILDEDVADSYERACHRIRQANLRSLPFHHNVLYGILQVKGELAASELHRCYEALAEDVYYGRDLTPIGPRSRRNKLSKLREYDLVEFEGPPQHRVYSVRDPEIVPEIEVSISCEGD